jgi:hypothetical protein
MIIGLRAAKNHNNVRFSPLLPDILLAVGVCITCGGNEDIET